MPIQQPVFVILPVGNRKHLAKVYKRGIEPALGYFKFEARRVDDQPVNGAIIDAIRRQIEEAFFLIADLSFARPNCYYELGLAEALGKPVLKIMGKGTRVHFDLAGQMIHSFGAADSVSRQLRGIIPEFLVTPKRKSKDTCNGEFGRLCIKDDYKLSAEVITCTKHRCLMSFEVCSLRTSRPLIGKVKFHMHSEYPKDQVMLAVRGLARFEEVQCNDGPWTLGAEIQETGTRLELDLAAIPGAKKWWYDRQYKKA